MLANRSVWYISLLSIFDLTCLAAAAAAAAAGLCFISGLPVHVADAVLLSLKLNFTPLAFSFKSAVTKLQIARNTYRSLHVCPWLAEKLYCLCSGSWRAKSGTLDIDMLRVLVSSGVVTCLICSL